MFSIGKFKLVSAANIIWLLSQFTNKNPIEIYESKNPKKICMYTWASLKVTLCRYNFLNLRRDCLSLSYLHLVATFNLLRLWGLYHSITVKSKLALNPSELLQVLSKVRVLGNKSKTLAALRCCSLKTMDVILRPKLDLGALDKEKHSSRFHAFSELPKLKYQPSLDAST